MTSEEFTKRFQKHPLGWTFQAMEVATDEGKLAHFVSMAHGMIMLLEFQGELSKEDHDFLKEAAFNNAQKNIQRIRKTNTTAPATKQ